MPNVGGHGRKPDCWIHKSNFRARKPNAQGLEQTFLMVKSKLLETVVQLLGTPVQLLWASAKSARVHVKAHGGENQTAGYTNQTSGRWPDAQGLKLTL